LTLDPGSRMEKLGSGTNIPSATLATGIHNKFITVQELHK
jgi:hypothetical protein